MCIRQKSRLLSTLEHRERIFCFRGCLWYLLFKDHLNHHAKRQHTTLNATKETSGCNTAPCCGWRISSWVEEISVVLKNPSGFHPVEGLCIKVCKLAAVGRYHTARKPKEGQNLHTERWLKDICQRRIFMMMKWESSTGVWYTVTQNLLSNWRFFWILIYSDSEPLVEFSPCV